MIADLAGSPVGTALAAEVSRTTEGNPFFVGEIVRYLARGHGPALVLPAAGEALPVPPSVQEVIGLRLTQIDEDARRLLGLAAVLGRGFTVQALAQAGEAPVADLLAMLE